MADEIQSEGKRLSSHWALRVLISFSCIFKAFFCCAFVTIYCRSYESCYISMLSFDLCCFFLPFVWFMRLKQSIAEPNHGSCFMYCTQDKNVSIFAVLCFRYMRLNIDKLVLRSKYLLSTGFRLFFSAHHSISVSSALKTNTTALEVCFIYSRELR